MVIQKINFIKNFKTNARKLLIFEDVKETIPDIS